jgi:anti-sigma factor RsiW
MTPQLIHEVIGAAGHLSEDQFGDLLASSAGPRLAFAEAHLLDCDQCAAELASLRESLSLFRQASNAYADNQLRRLPPVALPARGVLSPALQPTYWAVAAAIFLTAILPLQTLRQHTFHAAPAVSAGMPQSASLSDEALLQDVDSYTSASVPAPMQALADPGFASTTTTIQNPVQRKD